MTELQACVMVARDARLAGDVRADRLALDAKLAIAVWIAKRTQPARMVITYDRITYDSYEDYVDDRPSIPNTRIMLRSYGRPLGILPACIWSWSEALRRARGGAP